MVRVLNLLVAEGYVQRLPNRRGYVLDERVLTLSSGFRSHAAIARAAKPLMSSFTAEHKWPLSLATLEQDSMRVHAGTLDESPFSTEVDLRRLARRLPLLTSALGRAYLAFCPDDERALLMTLLRAPERKRDPRARELRFVSRIIGQVRKVGYAVSLPEPDNSAVGMAVPIMRGDRVLACLSLRYSARAMSEAEAAKRYLADLQATARAIAATAAN